MHLFPDVICLSLSFFILNEISQSGVSRDVINVVASSVSFVDSSANVAAV